MIVGVTGHFMLAADIAPEEIAARIPPGDLSQPMSAPVLSWLAHRLASKPATFDALLYRVGDGRGGVGPLPSGELQSPLTSP